MSQADINDDIKQVCDFFNIPMPWVDSRSHKCTKWSNHVCQLDRNSYNDDVLCFNMQQLIDMKVDSKSAFSLVIPHECAHRVLQATRFPGVNNGIWENELAADFLMGCRAGLWNMDDSKVCLGLAMANGSPTHPDGSLRVLFIQHGKYVTKAMLSNGISLTIQNLINEFMAFREQNLADILRLERKFYVF